MEWPKSEEKPKIGGRGFWFLNPSHSVIVDCPPSGNSLAEALETGLFVYEQMLSLRLSTCLSLSSGLFVYVPTYGKVRSINTEPA